MNIPNKLFIRPVAWSSVNPSAKALKANINLFPAIQFFGYTSDGRTAYVRIPRKSTFILKFGQEVDEEMVINISEILNPTSIKPSYMDASILVVRAPELSPIELTANPDYEGLATWDEVKQDPYGELESFWETREIGPYEWIAIDRYSPLPGKYTNCALNIITQEDNVFSSGDVDLPDIFPRLFFWDIETFASKQGEFPNSANPDDFIALISIITVSDKGANGFVIIKGNVNQDLINQKPGDMVVIKASDEKDLLTKFFGLYNTFQPDRQIYYNGDMFDMPYLLNRLSIHNSEIPRVSKVLSLTPWVIDRGYPTPFGREFERTMVLPGTEILDLIHFYRRFYPHFKNHKLDTVSKSFLGEGKTDLTITEMMEAIRTNDENKLAKVVDYSFVDSLRMKELWDASQVQNQLESVCNNIGVSIDTLLRSSFETIVDKAVYNIDAGSAIIKGKYDLPNHLKEAVKGIYRNVYIYDYSELYRQSMILSEQTIAVALGNRLEGAPPKLIMTAFYSPYIDRTELSPLLISMLDSVLETNMIIAVEPFIIRSIGPLNAEWLREINRSSCYVSVAKASYIVLNNSGELEPAGLSKLCRPKFELAEDIIKQYLTLIYSNNLKEFEVPDMKVLPIDKFAITERIGDIETLTPDSIKYKLAIQYGSPIVTWISVKYIMTTQGPTLLSKLKEDHIIDYEYYTNELNTYLRDLQALKIYGI
jgi:DNA polymerase elongation subunit (family B)